MKTVVVGSLRRRVRAALVYGMAAEVVGAAALCAEPFARAYRAASVTRSAEGSLQDGGTPDRPEFLVVPVNATPYGFNPLELTVRPGVKRLVIYNGSGVENANFILKREDNVPVLSGRIARGRRLNEVMNFVPGEIIVTEESHPNWQCRIRVEP